MNSRKKIIERNREYLKNTFNWEENQWFEFLREVGPPLNEFGNNPDQNNPTKGWCGGVTMALRLSGKVPKGYLACRNKNDPHFYMINQASNEVIDLTIYQFDGEYQHDYTEYNQRFMNVLSNSVALLMDRWNLDIDPTKFYTVKKRQTFIKKRR